MARRRVNVSGREWRMSSLRRAVALLALLGLALTASLVGATSASAVTCWGDYCSGKWPDATGCATGAVTTSARDFRGGRLELRWSPTCKTNWARLQIYPGGFAYTLSAVQDTGYTQSVQWPAGTPSPGTYWTPMIYSPVRLVQARATVSCFGIFDCATSGQVKTDYR
jgi:hypothetical protein